MLCPRGDDFCGAKKGVVLAIGIHNIGEKDSPADSGESFD